MREAGPYQFGFLVPGTPKFLSQWRKTEEYSVWDRHYILDNRHSVKISAGRRLEVTRRTLGGGLRVETDLVNSTFPLDWTVALVLRQLLPRPLRASAMEGRGSAQDLVDALAVDWLPQASVHKFVRAYAKGSLSATVSHLTVPDLGAEAILLDVCAPAPARLAPFLNAYRLGPVEDVRIDDWLSTALLRTMGERSRAA